MNRRVRGPADQHPRYGILCNPSPALPYPKYILTNVQLNPKPGLVAAFFFGVGEARGGVAFNHMTT